MTRTIDGRGNASITRGKAPRQPGRERTLTTEPPTGLRRMWQGVDNWFLAGERPGNARKPMSKTTLSRQELAICSHLLWKIDLSEDLTS